MSASHEPVRVTRMHPGIKKQIRALGASHKDAKKGATVDKRSGRKH